MNMDFWNNPIVVSAFRVKYRRSGPFSVTSVYLLLLAGGAVLLEHFQYALPVAWSTVFVVGLFSIQCLISPLAAMTATSASINSEVVDRTLDFQRIAAMSPRSIVVGKLLGEPAIAYLLAMATVPLSVWCMLLGSIAPGALVALYVNVATTTLLFGALGLQRRLEPSPQKTGSGGGSGAGMGILLLAFIGQAAFGIFRAAVGAGGRWRAAVGLVTPIPSIVALWHGDPWSARMPFFGLEVPYLIVTPVVQTGIVLVLCRIMVRRLGNPLNTSMSKPMAYVTLAIADGLAAGILFDPPPVGTAPAAVIALFCLVHLFVVFILTGAVTPRRTTAVSWIWRLRGQRGWAGDLWLGERTENVLALVTFCGIGVSGLCAGVLLPLGVSVSGPEWTTAWRTGAQAMLVSVVLILSAGTLYQWLVVAADRSGAVGCFLSMAILVIVPIVVGSNYELDLVVASSPMAHFLQWLEMGADVRGGAAARVPLSLTPLLLAYGVVLIYAWASLRWRMARHREVVNRKLAAMGIAGAPGGGRWIVESAGTAARPSVPDSGGAALR